MKLIIVESPTKSKTISQFLGSDFIVESCNGHIRNLPKSKMGIEIENNFKPIYIIPREKRKIVNRLKKISEKAEQVILACDEDREGEAIAWHLAEVLNLKTFNSQSLTPKIQRIVFHEITKEAIDEALKNPRGIDLNLVNAQQARRILDRLVGYKLSPLLWKKIARQLSAGRVQSPALRMIVEREREIESFVAQEYWTIVALLKTKNQESKIKNNEFAAILYKIGEKKIEKLDIKNREKVNEILKNLEGADYSVEGIEEKQIKKSPPPPFITSTLQQEANRRFGYSTKKTMIIAQQLYEGIELGKNRSVGLITYMRTDSFNLAEKFLIEVRKYIKENFNDLYLPKNFRFYKKKTKLAQEAHEAIRPTSIYREPRKIKEFLTKEQFKIYDLIWRRALSCQMSEAEIKNVTINVLAKKNSIANHYFKATGSQIKFSGWLDIYPIKIDEIILPEIKKEEKLDLIKIEPKQHFTKPPARYSEAGLIKALERYGIGRPSTYAPIIATLFERNYVQRKNGRLFPTEIGLMVNDLLVEHFPKIVDYQFTAEMEKKLDEIAQGRREWHKMVSEFYWPFEKEIDKKEKEIKKIIEEKTNEICEKCGKPMLIKFSRFGKFLACSGFPECKFTKSIDLPEKNSLKIKCPKCNQGEVVRRKIKKSGKFFYGCSRWPNCDYTTWEKPTS